MKNCKKIDLQIIKKIQTTSQKIMMTSYGEKLTDIILQSFKNFPCTEEILLCFKGIPVIYNDKKHKYCNYCEKSGDIKFSINKNCNLFKTDNYHIFVVKTPTSFFGIIAFKVTDFNCFNKYVPFLQNFINLLSIKIENDENKNALDDIFLFPDENLNPVLRISFPGQILYYNRAGRKYLQEKFANLPKQVPGFEKFLATHKKTKQFEIEEKINNKHYLLSYIVINEKEYVNLYIKDITEKKKMREEMHQQKNMLQALFDNMTNAFAYHRIITDKKSKPIDYIFLEVNKAFEEFTGLKKRNILGKKVTEVHPGIKKMDFDWIGTYGKVALTGKPIKFDQYFSPQKHWYTISAYCPKKNHFAVVFDNITEIKSTLKEKEVLLKEIHHRVKNNLHNISSLLHIKKLNSKNKETRKILSDSIERVYSIGLVHELLYASNNFSEINFSNYINKIVKYLSDSYQTNEKKIFVIIDCDDIQLEVNKAVPCGLLVNELLTNAFKYAFPKGRGGEVKISFKKNDKYCELRIEDNGIGISIEKDNKQSFGKIIIKQLAEQLNGKSQYYSENGTIFEIKFLY